jgi:hypothetical protein
MQLTTDPFTGNRYTFGAGNPVSNIELDGHVPTASPGGGPCPESGCPDYNAPSSGGGFWSNAWHGFLNWLASGTTAPTSEIVGNTYKAGGGMWMGANPNLAPLGNPADRLSNRVKQFGATLL